MLVHQDPVLNAQYLESNAGLLRAKGPLVEVTFESLGPTGMQIVNITCKLHEVEFDRVIVATGSINTPAFNKVFFGDQLVQVGGVSCLGMKMREVRLMIADCPRPMKVVVQPLCIWGQDFPLVPPLPTNLAIPETTWKLLTRAPALQQVGNAVVETHKRPIQCVALDPTRIFLTSTGQHIISCNQSTTTEQLWMELNNKKSSTFELTLQSVKTVELVSCGKCGNTEQHLFSRFCAQCGTGMGKQRREG
ncbi:hypothetical protein BASA81_000495 [Batrachochytrium salamandrivorans]|nr:hypothetical protein BASA81_000495 [Batrachochytrium salamandrivorans]